MVSKSHISGYLKIRDKAEIVAIADLRRSLAESTSKELGVDSFYDDYHALLKNDNVDAVDILVPHNHHLQVARDAAEAGKHIFIEKPLARNSREASEIDDAARKNGVRLMVANNLLFHPAVEKSTQLLEKGYLGKLSLAKAWSLGWFLYNVGISKYRKSIDQTGGGCLIDTGTHFVYLLRRLVGNIDQVTCYTANILNDLHKSVDKVDFVPEGEDTAVAMLHFRNGALGELTVSYSAKMEGWEWFWPSGWDQRIQIYGAEGALAIELPHNLLSLYSEKETIPKEIRGRNSIPIEKDYASTFDSEAQHFVESLLSNTPFRAGVNGIDGVEDLKVIEAAYQSAKENRPVAIN